MVVTPARLRPQLQAWMEKSTRPVYAIHHDGRWDGPEELEIGEHRVIVRVCPSELAVREALAAPRADDHGLVLLTAADRLGEDVLARLAKGRIHRLLAEDALLELFGVVSIDPEVTRQRWLVGALVEAAPVDGYERSGARELDRDRAWQALLRHRYGIELDAGLDGLLDWAGGPLRERLRAVDESERDHVVAHLTRRWRGSAPILAAVAEGAGEEVLALGLVVRVLADGPDGAERVAARTRFELRLGTWEFDEREARAWAGVAEIKLETRISDDAGRARALQAADRQLELMRATSLAGHSAYLVAGLRQRLGELAAAVDAELRKRGKPGAVKEAAERVRRHRSAAVEAGGTATMAERLLRWLERAERSDTTEHDLRALASRYASDDGYADWARTALRQGSGDARFDETARRLVERVDAVREAQEGAFARALARWSPNARTDDALLGVEDVLGRVVAPLARQRPVLLVVLDGMSHRTANELLDDVIRRGWTELRRAEHPGRALVVSALPSATEFSRTSLLAGRLQRGAAADERRAFGEHAELRAADRRTAPQLFHKGGLADDRGGLAPELSTAIGGDGRVVGVVVNAIDDHLARSEQLRMTWAARDIVPLGQLLDAARDASRVVVFASDHGHVLEQGTTLRTVTRRGGERWRPCGDPLVDGETEVAGTRVLAADGRCVLASSGSIRYAIKKNGYHGGATAQEVLAPLLVLAPSLIEELDGWIEVPYDPPGWWLGETVADERQPSEADAGPAAAPVVPGEQLALDASAVAPAASWIGELLESELFTTQRAAAGRTPVPEQRIVAILSALDAHSGEHTARMQRDALARACGIPPMRLTGTLAALRQILNVDGFAVLSVDDLSDDVTLNRVLLAQQFDLAGA